jgi:hypothetical protein
VRSVSDRLEKQLKLLKPVCWLASTPQCDLGQACELFLASVLSFVKCDVFPISLHTTKLK